MCVSTMLSRHSTGGTTHPGHFLASLSRGQRCILGLLWPSAAVTRLSQEKCFNGLPLDGGAGAPMRAGTAASQQPPWRCRAAAPSAAPRRPEGLENAGSRSEETEEASGVAGEGDWRWGG